MCRRVSINTHNHRYFIWTSPLKRSLLFTAMLFCGVLLLSRGGSADCRSGFADIVDRYAEHIFYVSGATGMALVVIDGNQRVFRSFGDTRPET